MAATLGTSIVALATLVPGMMDAFAGSIRSALLEVGAGPAAEPALVDRLGEGLGLALRLVLPLAGAVLVVGVLTNLAAGGLVLAGGAIRLDPARVNPLTGLRRLADRQMLVRLGLACAKLAVLAVAAWQVLGTRIVALVSVPPASLASVARDALDALFQLGLGLAILLGALALVDFVVQRRRALGRLRMTRDEVRREHRESEGDPLIRGQRRRRARQLAAARMMDAVPGADVVVVNPTEIAVALRYDSLTMTAPRIVAKGQRLMAARIRAVAAEHGVPVLLDKPLARALFARPIGSEVPPHLYRAVARLLVLVHQARFAVRAGGAAPAGRSTRQFSTGAAR